MMITQEQKKSFETLAISLLPAGWKFSWSCTSAPLPRSAYGICYYDSRTIIVRRNETAPMILDTIAHEVAHAQLPGRAHDGIWQALYTQLVTTARVK